MGLWTTLGRWVTLGLWATLGLRTSPGLRNHLCERQPQAARAREIAISLERLGRLSVHHGTQIGVPLRNEPAQVRHGLQVWLRGVHAPQWRVEWGEQPVAQRQRQRDCGI